jgi:hypothetical protein
MWQLTEKLLGNKTKIIVILERGKDQWRKQRAGISFEKSHGGLAPSLGPSSAFHSGMEKTTNLICQMGMHLVKI